MHVLSKETPLIYEYYILPNSVELYVRFVLLSLCISSLLSNEKFYPFSKEKKGRTKMDGRSKGPQRSLVITPYNKMANTYKLFIHIT